MTDISNKLTRDWAFEHNMDPRGVKWGIGKVIGTALYHVDILEGNKNTKKPDSLDGMFTNPTLAQKAIESYLKEVWDHNDKVEQRQAIKERAKAEGKDG